MKESYTSRLAVSNSKDFSLPSSELWNLISAKENLNSCHPFCELNKAFEWEEGKHSDRLVYLNGRDYTRNFLTWDEGAGYTLLIGSEGGPLSYVEWKITSLSDNSSNLSITVYPYILAKLPKVLAYIPHKLWVEPRMKKYLHSVLSGFDYFSKTGDSVPRNHFGRHPWFS